MKYKFPALIIKEEDGFVVEFPDLEDAFKRIIYPFLNLHRLMKLMCRQIQRLLCSKQIHWNTESCTIPGLSERM